MIYRSLSFFALLTISFTLSAQTDVDNAADKWFDDWTVKPILGLQAWGTYTMGHKDYDADAGAYVDADNRINFMVRRLRFGTTAQVGDRLFIKFLGAADFVGADQRSGTVGGVNNGGFPNAQIWDIYAQYKLTPASEALYVVGGYLRPPIGRESMAGAFGVSSFEKSWSQWYVRQHLVGTGPGGTGGVYLGGLSSFSDNIHMDYRAGVFNAQNNGISAGRESSALLVSRLNLMFGDPESETWAYGLGGGNSFGRRNTVAIALNAANEGGTDAAPGGIGLLGVDALVNFGQFHAEGEYHSLSRSVDDEEEYISETYFVRVGYNFVIPTSDPDRPRYLEPTAMVYGFQGTKDFAEYDNVTGTSFFGGTETVFDVGINYHLKPGKVKLGLHYVGRSGDIGDLPPNGSLSWNNMQNGIGGIERGDYLGFEVILVY